MDLRLCDFATLIYGILRSMFWAIYSLWATGRDIYSFPWRGADVYDISVRHFRYVGVFWYPFTS